MDYSQSGKIKNIVNAFSNVLLFRTTQRDSAEEKWREIDVICVQEFLSYEVEEVSLFLLQSLTR